MSMDTKAPSQAVSDGQEDEEEQDGDSSPFLFPESAIEDSTEILLLPSPPSSRHSTSSHTHPLDQTPSATRQTIFLLLAILPEGILESMLIPLYPYMARGFGIGEEDVGYWSGVASSAFYMPLLVMNVVWGAASDRIGRKPILLASLLVSLMTTTLLLTSTTLTQTLLARLLAGIFGANSTLTKSLLGTILPPSRQGWGYAMYGLVYGVSGVVGPLLAGALVSTNSQRPYAPPILACLLLQFLAFGLVFRYVYEPQRSSQQQQKYHPVPSSTTTTTSSKYPLPLHALAPIIIYTLTALTQSLTLTALPLYLSSPSPSGLHLPPSTTSFTLTLLSGTKLLIQLLVVQHLLNYIGAKPVFIMGSVCFAVGNMLLAFLPSYKVVEVIMVILGVAEVLGYTAVILLITRAVEETRLGLAHGVGSTCAAAVRGAAPAGAGALWGVGVRWGGAWVGGVFWGASMVSVVMGFGAGFV